MKRQHALFYLALSTICAANPPLVHGQRAIFLLRHAERVDYEDQTGLLSEAGLARAQRLVNVLKDAGVTAIYTSKFKRTIQTAEPLAVALNIPLISIGPPGPWKPMDRIAADQVKATVARLRSFHRNDVVVIVGHQNTVLMMLKALGSQQDFTIGDREHDDLFVVLPTRDGPPTVLRLNY